MSLDRVLDRQLVEVELTADGVELRLARLDEPDPGKGAGLTARFERVVQAQLTRTPDAVLVERHVDDHVRRLCAETAGLKRRQR